MAGGQRIRYPGLGPDASMTLNRAWEKENHGSLWFVLFLIIIITLLIPLQTSLCVPVTPTSSST